MKGIDASAQYHVDLMLIKKHIRACVHILMASIDSREGSISFYSTIYGLPWLDQ